MRTRAVKLAARVWPSLITIEVRCGYSDEHLVRSQFAPHIDIAEDIATAWKQAAIEKGFTKVHAGGNQLSLNLPAHNTIRYPTLHVTTLRCGPGPETGCANPTPTRTPQYVNPPSAPR